MTSRRGHAVLLSALVLMLSGCFRQASPDTQPIEQQPVSSTSAPVILPSATPDQEATPLDSQSATEIVPTSIIAVTQSTPIIPPTDLPTNTPEPVLETPTDTGSGVNVQPIVTATVTSQSAIITPVLPSGGGAVTMPTQPEPTATSAGAEGGLVTPTSPAPEVAGECVYIVNPGDNLFRIALNNNTTLDELRASNPQITGDIIQPGDRLILPNCQPTGESEEGSGGTGGAVVPPDGGSAGGIIHVVSAGETLAIIARQYGVTITAIAQANNLTDPNRLSVGQELVIPGN